MHEEQTWPRSLTTIAMRKGGVAASMRNNSFFSLASALGRNSTVLNVACRLLPRVIAFNG